ncbi:MAG: YabP/YqfC family sporulation protein [Oscillospiraceae bacterium]|nr:YabP/YqfC family sporulation protein [Oscillospiraceae bacterium]
MNVNKIAGKFDKLKSSFYKHSYIQMTDSSELVIDRCERVSAYDENVIKLELLNNALVIIGTALTMRNFSTDGVIIKGNIRSMEFLKLGEEK